MESNKLRKAFEELCKWGLVHRDPMINAVLEMMLKKPGEKRVQEATQAQSAESGGQQA